MTEAKYLIKKKIKINNTSTQYNNRVFIILICVQILQYNNIYTCNEMIIFNVEKLFFLDYNWKSCKSFENYEAFCF